MHSALAPLGAVATQRPSVVPGVTVAPASGEQTTVASLPLHVVAVTVRSRGAPSAPMQPRSTSPGQARAG
ncbi:MAG: hypothetical protein M5U28_04190 [Sandaracinaceae bacterium]|nr:hypothetical protein [Sandaracinaceae bacterium]